MPRSILILMYHGILSETIMIPPDREEGADFYDVPVDVFKKQMKYLKDQNYTVMTAGAARSANQEKPAVILTFDDGELNNYSEAWPILRQYRYQAYFFVTVNRIGTAGYMDWDNLKEISRNGMIIGSHGLNHQVLTTLTSDQIQWELRESKSMLEKYLQKEIASFSVPRGFYNQNVIASAKQAGYKFIFVSQKSSAADADVWERVAVKKNWTLPRFVQALQNQKPFGEMLTCSVIRLAKGVLGGQLYDKFRRTILRLNK